MKLNIKKIKIKNLLSIGSKPVEFEFNKGIYLVTGKINGKTVRNGCGKSLIFVDAIVFALYGKSMRGLNLDQMINSINKEKCEVTLWIEINNKNYKIERGIKPGYLRVYEENENKPKELGSKSKAQKKLEKILGISFLSFKSIITQNINSTKPFFEMQASERRQFLEDIVNLTVYGKIFELIKKEHNDYKNNKRVLVSEYESVKNLYKDKVSTYKKINLLKENFEKEKQEKIASLTDEIEKLKKQKNEIEIPEKDYDELKDKINNKIIEIKEKRIVINQTVLQNEKQINKNTKEIEKIQENPICPICKTPTDSEHPKKHIEKILKENEDLTSETKTNKTKINNIDSKLKELKEKLQKINKKCKKVNSDKEKLKEIESNLFHTNKKLEYEKEKEFDINDVITKNDVLKTKKQVLVKQEELNKESTNLVYTQRLKEIFGDKGIKNYIIKKILPVLNKKLNEYLMLFNASYSLHFDEELNENLKSRGCQNFSYNNFSSGERKRIDLALMFTLIYIAKTRNSVDCNILVLDEVLDTSLCADGTESFITFLKTSFKELYPNLCTYIITHKSDITEDNFDGIIEIEKDNEFTKIKNNK